MQKSRTRGDSAYVIVCGNEKGGSGKTTTAMHLAVSLLNTGHRVATIDLDSRQQSLSRYVENRESWARKNGLRLPLPVHYAVQSHNSDLISERESNELIGFTEVVSSVEQSADFIVVDTPGHDSYLMRLSHSMADTLVTPMNDSYVDFDVLGRIDPETHEVVDISHYARTVREARRQRRRADNGLLDWVVVRNRLTQIRSRNKTKMLDSLKDLSMRLGCRLADGISERVIFRELFPTGLTALDDVGTEDNSGAPSLSHLAARQEVRALIAALRLPIDDSGKRRATARRNWMEGMREPLQKKMSLIAE